MQIIFPEVEKLGANLELTALPHKMLTHWELKESMICFQIHLHFSEGVNRRRGKLVDMQAFSRGWTDGGALETQVP